MTKILFEKIHKGEPLYSWTRLFDSKDDLIEFIIEHKEHLLGLNDYYIKIREIEIFNRKEV